MLDLQQDLPLPMPQRIHQEAVDKGTDIMLPLQAQIHRPPQQSQIGYRWAVYSQHKLVQILHDLQPQAIRIPVPTQGRQERDRDAMPEGVCWRGQWNNLAWWVHHQAERIAHHIDPRPTDQLQPQEEERLLHYHHSKYIQQGQWGRQPDARKSEIELGDQNAHKRGNFTS